MSNIFDIQRSSQISKSHRFAKIFYVFFVVFITNFCTFSRLSRSLWTQHFNEQIIEITYFVDRWKMKSNELTTLKAIKHRSNKQKFMISMFLVNQKISRQFQIRYTFIFMLIFKCFILSSLHYLQSELTTHEELNRVKNIFKNCCSILLNCDKITKYSVKNVHWADKQQNVWKCIQIDRQNSQQSFQQDSQLLTKNRCLLRYFRIFVDLFCFNDRSFQRQSTNQRDFKKRSSLRRERFSWSLRDETEKKREVMWRAYIEFNICQN